jgi:hypothetical protein
VTGGLPPGLADVAGGDRATPAIQGRIDVGARRQQSIATLPMQNHM